MTKRITESGMCFIADNTFHIENSVSYATLKESIKTVEFIRAKDDKLLFMEAKSSFPNPNNPVSTAKFQSAVDDICNKFIHSLNLYASIAIGVNGEFPPDFNPAIKVSLKFILIINNFEQKWCIPIEKALINQLRKSECIAKIWKPTVFVMNHKIASKQNFIQ
ncbi:hypothetical protein M2138_001292 [Dysgonomonadaceae bacterium PH5-43]|nr:hypothetical protein [Dysgonomonadaceae bacterium PH5-43]